MKYAVTITTRNINGSNVDVITKYCEYDTIADLNNFIFSNICNAKSSSEIIGLYFEVFN